MEVWGDFACFADPASKVERLTYPVPTPSAVRGIFSSVYSKPKEFYWQPTRVEVLNPISYISFKRNELKSTASGKDHIIADEDRTQRQTVALQNVRYRLAASIVPRPAFRGKETQLYEQALRRIRGGKCYMQPCFGHREFVAYFQEYCPQPGEQRPIDQSMDLGLMVYDVFDFVNDMEVSKKTKPALSLFRGEMNHGVIIVPPYESAAVLKGEDLC